VDRLPGTRVGRRVFFEALGKHLGLFAVDRGQLNRAQVEAVLDGVAAIIAKYVPSERVRAAVTELTRIANDTYALTALPEPSDPGGSS